MTPQQALDKFEGFDFDEAFTDHELEQITNAMHFYASHQQQEIEALRKEVAQKQIDIEMTRLGWDGTIEKKEEFQNQSKALSAIKRGLEKNVQSLTSQLEQERNRAKGLCDCLNDVVGSLALNDTMRYKIQQALNNYASLTDTSPEASK
jgi:hypothetical protein